MVKPVKVLSLVSYKFLPPDMGGQKNIAFFNRYLARMIPLLCVTTQENSPHGAEGYRVMNVLDNHKLRYTNIFYFFTLNRIIKENNITHLLIEHPYYGWLAILLKWFCKVKLIIHSHNIEGLRFKSIDKWWWGILWHYEKLVHHKADHNFFINDHDRNYAIKNFKLNPYLCTVITYGFELNNPPAAADKQTAREQVCKKHGIRETERLLLFNGTLDYKPNLDALDIILEKINPLLLACPDLTCKIIICGNKLPARYGGLVNYQERNIIYAGFVDDINLYFKGCDIFINPVIDGGGIKTKVVEALGNNLSVVSTYSGAIGIPADITGEKMLICEDTDWPAFVNDIRSIKTGATIPQSFFDHFYWGNIAAKAAAIIDNL